MNSEQTIIVSKTTILEPSKIVGLISDTHVPSRAKRIPKMVFKTFEKADYIIHAGDIVELSVIDKLEELAPVLAVHGNMDRQKVSGALPKINSLKVFLLVTRSQREGRLDALELTFVIFVSPTRHCAPG